MGFFDKLKNKTVEFDADSAFLAIASGAFGIVLTAAARLTSPVGAAAAGLGVLVPSLIKGIKIKDKDKSVQTIYTERFNEIAAKCARAAFGEETAEDVLNVLMEVKLSNIDIYDGRAAERSELVSGMLSARQINVARENVDKFMDSLIFEMCRAVQEDDALRKFVVEKLLLAGYRTKRSQNPDGKALYLRLSDEYTVARSLRTYLRDDGRIKRYADLNSFTVGVNELREWMEQGE